MLPPYILFDLDDTLFDHTHASRAALAHLHDSHFPEVAFEMFVHEHVRLLEIHHHRFLNGELTMDQARAARMRELFSMFGRPIDDATALDVGAQYRREHQNNRQLVDGARELLDALAGRVRLGIVTNNSVAEQMEKLRTLDIGRYFDTLVMSEDVGIAKPDKRIFEIALERMGAAAHETVMIGDSFSADIEGARNANIPALWFNRKEQETPVFTGVSSQKALEMPANRGVSNHLFHEINTLAPTDAVLDAIKEIHEHSLAMKESRNANLETLAL
jgi:YjjG family noncanonical pyrimidine nucleotidase